MRRRDNSRPAGFTGNIAVSVFAGNLPKSKWKAGGGVAGDA